MIELERVKKMELLNLFNLDVMAKAIALYDQNNIIILRKDAYYAEAIVYDEYFYKVEITFNHNYSILYPRVTNDGVREINPFSSPYAAALLYKLHRQDTYGLTFAYEKTIQLEEKSEQESFITEHLINLRCSNRLLKKIISYMLRLQNYNKEENFTTFSNIIDDLFEYFDAIKKPQERLVALQLFLHIYSHLEFDFNLQDEIKCALMDECNVRIYEIIEQESDPTSKYFYQTILLTDDKIHPMLHDYNKGSSLNH